MHVPNPFKRQKSTDDLSRLKVNADAGRVVLGDLFDGGRILASGWSEEAKVRVWVEDQKLIGGVWSEKETVVSPLVFIPSSSYLII